MDLFIYFFNKTAQLHFSDKIIKKIDSIFIHSSLETQSWPFFVGSRADLGNIECKVGIHAGSDSNPLQGTMYIHTHTLIHNEGQFLVSSPPTGIFLAGGNHLLIYDIQRYLSQWASFINCFVKFSIIFFHGLNETKNSCQI